MKSSSSLPVLTAFVDGLKYDSVAKMPFLSSLVTRRRIRTDLGYSVTCHATIYSGVYPQRHRMWFLWKYSPNTSPYRWLPDTAILDWVDGLPMHYAVGKMTRLFTENTSYSGLATMKRSPLKNWRYFDLAENKLWDEPEYLGSVPTVFDILRGRGIPWQSVGLRNGRENGGDLSHIEAHTVPTKIPAWTYLFIGNVDHVSHFHTQDSPEARKVLAQVDTQIERVYLGMKERIGQEPLFFCFSDHGHMCVEQQFDIYEHFYLHGDDLDRYMHIIDMNYARFWFRNSQEENRVLQVMSGAPAGYFLDEDHLRKYHTLMPDNRYGDAIFYLDWPFMFKKTVWGYGLRTKSIHGYLPDYAEKDGCLVSNMQISKKGHVELVDILPSLLDLLGISTELEFDGHCIW